MITYNDLYEALRKERYSEALQPLPQSFIKDVVEYLHEKKEIASKETNVFSEAVIKAKKQFENAIAMFHELMRLRKKKLLNLAFIAAETGISKRDYELMLDFEKEIFDKIMASLTEGEKKLNEMLNGQLKEEKKTVMIVFRQDVPEFFDFSGRVLGPFKKGDVANLQQEVAEILVKDGKAEYVM